MLQDVRARGRPRRSGSSGACRPAPRAVHADAVADEQRAPPARGGPPRASRRTASCSAGSRHLRTRTSRKQFVTSRTASGLSEAPDAPGTRAGLGETLPERHEAASIGASSARGPGRRKRFSSRPRAETARGQRRTQRARERGPPASRARSSKAARSARGSVRSATSRKLAARQPQAGLDAQPRQEARRRRAGRRAIAPKVLASVSVPRGPSLGPGPSFAEARAEQRERARRRPRTSRA